MYFSRSTQRAVEESRTVVRVFDLGRRLVGRGEVGLVHIGGDEAPLVAAAGHALGHLEDRIALRVDGAHVHGLADIALGNDLVDLVGVAGTVDILLVVRDHGEGTGAESPHQEALAGSLGKLEVDVDEDLLHGVVEDGLEDLVSVGHGDTTLVLHHVAAVDLLLDADEAEVRELDATIVVLDRDDRVPLAVQVTTLLHVADGAVGELLGIMLVQVGRAVDVDVPSETTVETTGRLDPVDDGTIHVVELGSVEVDLDAVDAFELAVGLRTFVATEHHFAGDLVGREARDLVGRGLIDLLDGRGVEISGEREQGCGQHNGTVANVQGDSRLPSYRRLPTKGTASETVL